MFEFIIGCDMSKSTFDSSYRTESEEAKYLGFFNNVEQGFEIFLNANKKVTNHPINKWLVVFENTGVYSKQFKHWLISKGIACVEETPIKISSFDPLKRAKTDPADSKNICEYGFEKRHRIKPDLAPDALTESIKDLYSRRSLLIKQKTAQIVSVKEKSICMDQKMKELFQCQAKQLVELLTKQIKQIEKTIESLLNKRKEIRQNYKLVKSVIGVGPITAGLIICWTGNFKLISCPRKFASFIGIAPFANSSGIRKRKSRVSSKAKKELKGAISNCVVAAKLNDPFLKKYVSRLEKKNKNKGIIYNNLKNKLIQRVFCVVKRQSPYVKLNFQ